MFSSFCFRQNEPGKCVYDILDRKNAFLDYKNMKLEKTKNWDFLKGLVHDFCQKMAIFSSFYFRQNRPGKCVLRYS